MQRKWTLVNVAVTMAFVGTMWVAAAPPTHYQLDPQTAALMRSKLTHAQDVLEGLLRKDLDKIARGAREMKRISEAAEWPRAHDDVYKHFGVEFRRQCKKLEDLANKGNHEGATFTYLQMTNTCINCHDYVRDRLQVAAPGLRGDVQLIPSQWAEEDLQQNQR